MKIKSIYVNLPVKDINRTRDFWAKLGFSFSEQFSNETSLCLVLNDGLMYAMFITHEFFAHSPTDLLQTVLPRKY